MDDDLEAQDQWGIKEPDLQPNQQAPIHPIPDDELNFQPVLLLLVLEPGADQDQADQPSVVPRAFIEQPQVRMAYLQAVKSNVYGHLTVQQATVIRLCLL